VHVGTFRDAENAQVAVLEPVAAREPEPSHRDERNLIIATLLHFGTNSRNIIPMMQHDICCLIWQFIGERLRKVLPK
jgi:hypothetical protein